LHDFAAAARAVRGADRRTYRRTRQRFSTLTAYTVHVIAHTYDFWITRDN